MKTSSPGRRSPCDRSALGESGPRSVGGGTRRAPSIFTKAGRNVVLLAFGIGFAAMNTGNNLLYIIFGLLLGMILASGFVSEGVLRPVRVSLLWPGEIFAGAPFPLRVIINNPSRRPLIGLQAWATVTPPGSVAAETPPAAFLYVPARSQAGRDIPLAASARGDLRLVHIRVGTLFPFGFSRNPPRPFDEVRVVYPARVPVPRRALAVESPSPRQSTDRRGAGDAFWGLRDFQEGDSPRRVAWKSAARLGRLIVRENERKRKNAFCWTSAGPRTGAASPRRTRKRRFLHGLLAL
ncbi:MAG: DUF58 domain-containing protein [Elusimicrobia bacterium]|nr:DUF58 domain-containing protein [Elusimicrobiota bacterium]